MREWIRTLLRWLDARLIGDGETFPVYRSDDGGTGVAKDRRSGRMEIIFSNLIQTGPPAHVAERERFRVAAFRAAADDCCEDCGRALFWLDLQFRRPTDEEWRPLLMLPEMKLSVVQAALDDMAAFLDSPEARVQDGAGAMLTVHGTRLAVRTERYEHGGGLAVQLIDVADGLPYATISVNVEGVGLAGDEFVFKTYSENEGLLEDLLDAGIVELTGRQSDVGPICRLMKGGEEGKQDPSSHRQDGELA